MKKNRKKHTARNEKIKAVLNGTLWMVKAIGALLSLVFGSVSKGSAKAVAYLKSKKVRRPVRIAKPAPVHSSFDEWYLGIADVRLTRVFTAVLILHIIAAGAILWFKANNLEFTALPAVTNQVSKAVVAEKSVTSDVPELELLAPAEVKAPEAKVFYDLATVNEIPLAEVLAMFSDSRFFKPGSIANVRPEVLRAWTILYEEMVRLGVRTRFTPHQLATIAWRESGQGDRINPHTAMIATRHIGDKKLYHKAFGGLQLRKPAWEEVIEDKDGRMPFAPELMSELRGLGITNEDFLGNLPFSVLVLEWWHYRYSPMDSDYYSLAGRYVSGPGLFPNKKSRDYGDWCVSRLELVEAMTLAPLPAVENEMLTQVEAISVKGTIAEDETEALHVPSPAVPLKKATVSESSFSRFVATMKSAWVLASAWWNEDETSTSIAVTTSKDVTAPFEPAVMGPPSFTAKYTKRHHHYGVIVVEAKGGEIQPSPLFPDEIIESAQLEYAYLDQSSVTTEDNSSDKSKVAFYGPAQ